MKQKLLLSLTVCLLAFTSFVQAQCDPWINRAYKEIYQQAPSAGDCSIRNYNGGNWGSFPELVEYIVKYNNGRNASFKGDPWIFRAYYELFNRTPTAFEVNVNNYNSGAWNNYNELKQYIQQFQNNLRSNGITIKLEASSSNGSTVLAGIYDNQGRLIAANSISTNGGSVVAAGGANVVAAGESNLKPLNNGGYVVAAGGANVVAAGGANVVAAGGANVVAAGGGNIQLSNNIAGLHYGGQYRTLSGNERMIPASGKSSLIIK